MLWTFFPAGCPAHRFVNLFQPYVGPDAQRVGILATLAGLLALILARIPARQRGSRAGRLALLVDGAMTLATVGALVAAIWVWIQAREYHDPCNFLGSDPHGLATLGQRLTLAGTLDRLIAAGVWVALALSVVVAVVLLHQRWASRPD